MSRPLAAAQTVPIPGDVPTNIAQHTHLIIAAAGEDAQLILFPELSLTGYELQLCADLAFGLDDPRLDPLRDLARTHDTIIVAGAPVQVDGRLHIGAVILSPDGGAKVYTKRRLGAFPPSANPGGAVPPPEPSVFQPGVHDPLIGLDAHTAAVAICADVGDPAHAARAAARGADVYLASMFVIPEDIEQDEARLQDRATRHAMTVLFANYSASASSGGLPAAGRSAVFRGDVVLGRLPADACGLLLADCKDADWSARQILL